MHIMEMPTKRHHTAFNNVLHSFNDIIECKQFTAIKALAKRRGVDITMDINIPLLSKYWWRVKSLQIVRKKHSQHYLLDETSSQIKHKSVI